MILTSRRRLLMALAASPLLWPGGTGAAVYNTPRIIALEWLPVELLLALGVAPLGVAELHNYRQWARDPALPASTVDIGLRTEPNLELITQMEPTLLLSSQGYGPVPEKLARIAPVMTFTFSNQAGQPLTAARQSLWQLAQRLGLQNRARQHLMEFDDHLAALRLRLANHPARPVLLISLLDSRHAMVFGRRSLFQEVMQQLGIENAWQGETSYWGSTIVGIERLAPIAGAQVICFDHGNDDVMAQVSSTVLWQSLDFVRARRFTRVPGLWFYGATLTAMAFCRRLEYVLVAA